MTTGQNKEQNDHSTSADTEYNSLRQEILEALNRQLKMIRYSVTATTAILAIGFTVKNSFVFLLPLPILYGTLEQLYNDLRNVLTVATYIRIAIEPNCPDLAWEGVVYQLRTKLRDNLDAKVEYSIAKNESNYAIFILTLGMACILFSALLGYTSSAVEFGCITVSLVFWVWFSVTTFLRFEYVKKGKYEVAIEKSLQSILSES